MPGFVTNSKRYGWDAPETVIRSVRRRCIIFVLASLVLSLVCGLLPTGVARHNWVSFAGTAALVAVMLEIIAVVRFCLARTYLDYRTFHSIHWMMDYATIFHAMLMTVALVAGIVSCIQAFTGWLDILALLLFALAAAASVLLRRTYKRLPLYTVEEHHT